MVRKSQPFGQSQACLLRATLQKGRPAYTAHCYFDHLLSTRCDKSIHAIAIQSASPLNPRTAHVGCLVFVQVALPPSTEWSHLPLPPRIDPRRTPRPPFLRRDRQLLRKLSVHYPRKHGRETSWSGVPVCQFRPATGLG